MTIRRTAILAGFMAGLFLPVPAFLAAQDAALILRTAEEKQAERWKTVSDYTITKAIEVAGGAQAPMHFEKFTSDAGTTHFRFVMPGEYTRAVMEEAGFPAPAPHQLDQMAMGYEMVGAALNRGGGDMPPMPGAGMMMGDGATFLRAAAQAQREENDGRADAENSAKQMAEFARRARLDGRVTLDPKPIVRDLEAQLADGDPSILSWVPDAALQAREAYLLVADGLEDVKLDGPDDGGSFTLREARLWIDAEHYVPLRLLMEGEVENDGRRTPLTIEKFNLDYRQAGPLYEPFAEVFRLSGIMSGLSDEDRAQMEQARKDLAEAKKQLEQMPASQRAMVERMMKGQLEKAEKMLAGDAFLTSVRTVSLAVNEGPPTPFGAGSLTAGSATYRGALTIAGHSQLEDGRTRAELAIAAATETGSEASITLFSDHEFPAAGTGISISDASGWVRTAGQEGVSIEGGTGSIAVETRTSTRIAGTFTASLTGHDSDGSAVTINANGTFDSGAPVGPDQAPRGSPFPADLLEMGPPPGSPAASGTTPR